VFVGKRPSVGETPGRVKIHTRMSNCVVTLVDRAARLSEVSNARGTEVLSEYNYTLDEVGNPIQVAGTEGIVTYAYDSLDRLT
jgi:hypothetical protein